MAFEKLKYISPAEQRSLIDDIGKNKPLYLKKDFSTYSSKPEWNLESPTAEIDLDILKQLKGGTNHDYEDAKVLNKALRNMTPFLANESGIWARLSHVECIDCCYARWPNLFDAETEYIKTKLLCNNFGRRWRENAISRLWYSYYLADKIVKENPIYNFNFDDVLKDISFPETHEQIFGRGGTAKFSSLLAGIINTRFDFKKQQKAKLGQNRFRKFMTIISRVGAGLPFNLMDKREIDTICSQALNETIKAMPVNG